MYEINLVPDVKAEMIKAQKRRNLVFFVCGAFSAIAIGVVIVLGAVRAGQEIKIKSQDNTLELMSGKLVEYSGLNELLTIKKQLSDLKTIESDKRVFSRVFTVLASMLPTGSDTVTISSLSVDLDASTMSLEGQANAGADTDGIDYRVLEAFTKQVGLMKYDYGRYVDKNGAEIPTMCISETDEFGIPYTDENGLYAFWAKGVKGCDPSVVEEDEVVDEEEVEEAVAEEAEKENKEGEDKEGKTEEKKEDTAAVEAIKIYRTPKFREWYASSNMETDGTIQGVPHFESQCITYTGVEMNGNVKWVSENSCDLAPGGIEVTDSRNGRQSGGDLVLTFTGTIELDPAVFDYNNKHMIAIAPTGRVNVTDSLLQIETMFSERAIECAEGDTACKAGS